MPPIYRQAVVAAAPRANDAFPSHMQHTGPVRRYKGQPVTSPCAGRHPADAT